MLSIGLLKPKVVACPSRLWWRLANRGSALADGALYYPYIHIRDPDWLKATLLLFSQVRRLTPDSGPQADNEPILAFTQWQGGRAPMLASANLWSDRAIAAQVELAARLQEDAQDLDFRSPAVSSI